MRFEVRDATAADRPAIVDLVRRAFTGPDHDGSEEVEIIEETWRRGASPPGLELVADDGGTLVGHVLGALGDCSGTALPGIAPLCVSPERQGEGVGSALMVELLTRLTNKGWPVVVLLGDPRYYGRFGFSPAGELGVTYKPVGAGNPHFMAKVLASGVPSVGGTYRYCWELPSPG